ncbi:PepSY domain-containing protein [Gracilibacillus timonensis]|uniref:PepSY domain-containing protein n=1 Tax=Gracilibacillus timonensis TaxID=1816696 RepID=UPI0008258229|nr:PepSY domain-containing protein [Gracilibacillus timonensis]
MKKRGIVWLTLLLLLLLAACNNNDNNDTVDERPANENYNDPDVDITETNTNGKHLSIDEVALSVKEALDLYQQTFPDTQVDSIDLDEENGELIYEIDGFDDTNEYTAHIDGSGEVIYQEEEALDADDQPQALAMGDYVAIENAIITAKQAPEADNLTTTSWSLDEDNGVIAYEITFKDTEGQEVEVTIDAETGEQLSVEMES